MFCNTFVVCLIIIKFNLNSAQLRIEYAFPHVQPRIQQLTKKLPSLGFFKCDGDLPVNSQMFQHAQFYSGLWVFTATQELGIGMDAFVHFCPTSVALRILGNVLL